MSNDNSKFRTFDLETRKRNLGPLPVAWWCDRFNPLPATADKPPHLDTFTDEEKALIKALMGGDDDEETAISSVEMNTSELRAAIRLMRRGALKAIFLLSPTGNAIVDRARTGR